jgi:hypothetical protein
MPAGVWNWRFGHFFFPSASDARTLSKQAPLRDGGIIIHQRQLSFGAGLGAVSELRLWKAFGVTLRLTVSGMRASCRLRLTPIALASRLACNPVGCIDGGFASERPQMAIPWERHKLSFDRSECLTAARLVFSNQDRIFARVNDLFDIRIGSAPFRRPNSRSDTGKPCPVISPHDRHRPPRKICHSSADERSYHANRYFESRRSR